MTKKMPAILVLAVVCACSGGKDGGGTTTGTDPNAGGSPSTADLTAGEPNGARETATQLTSGTPVVASLPVGDYDFYKFTVPAGGATVHVQTFDEGGTGCASIDTDVEVYDSSPVVDPADAWVMESDDTGIGTCEDFTVDLPAGTNYVAVSGWSNFQFNYTVKVTVP